MAIHSFGRAASIYNIMFRPEVFGLSVDGAQAEIDRMLKVVSRWREVFKENGVCDKDIEAPYFQKVSSA